VVSEDKKTGIILVGGGGHCKSVIDVLVDSQEFKIIGILDMKDKVGSNLLGFPIIGTDEDIPELVIKYKHFHITIGHILSNFNRVNLFHRIVSLGGVFPVIKAYDAHISKYALIQPGSFIGHKTVVNAGAKIGFNCIINTGAVIEHDSIVENSSHISTCVTVNADCQVGEGSFLSSHVVINRGVKIPPESRIYSGSIVTKSFKERGLSLKGIPAKIV
jgi:sugar O-acyltransferase (sialic acid O-acetyltransferase NeuD family)